MAEQPYGEETKTVTFGGGLFTADLPSAIPENYCAQCDNGVSTGTSVENRFGFKKSSLDFSELSYPDEDLPGFTQFGPSGNADNPILMWGQRHPDTYVGAGPVISTYKTHFLREGNPYEDVSGGGDGYFSLTTDPFLGAVNYNNVIYSFHAAAIRKITAINWVAGSITVSTVLSTPPSMTSAPIHFFDRLWVAGGNKLYFTDAVSTPGGLPETWNISTNFISIIGTNGPGKIFKIIPLGSRIFIFTSAGLFSLTIAGSPSDWNLRPLDDKAVVNTYECAFENGGLLYYTTIYGVFVSNGSDSVKLSGSIENFFLMGNFTAGAVATKQSTLNRIHFLDGGLVVSLMGVISATDGSGDIVFDAVNSHTFYSRLGSVAWSEWNYNTPVGDTKMISVCAVADSLLSYVNPTPLSYMMVLNTYSTAGVKNVAQKELMVYDGLRDEWTNPGWTQTAPPVTLSTQSNILVRIATRYYDGDALINTKVMKYGFLEIYCSNAEKLTSISPQWSYEWRTEGPSFPFEADSLSDDNYDVISSFEEFLIVKLRSGFAYRTVQFFLELDTNNSETFKVKNLYFKQDTSRDGPYFVQ